MKKFFFHPLSIAILLLIFGCTGAGFSGYTPGAKSDSLFLVTEGVDIYYDLKEVEEKYFLPYVLSEVSGLSWVEDYKVATIEDEGGRMFIYDFEKRDIVHSIRFSDAGDYEGVEYVAGEYFVLESDGDVYRFRDEGSKQLDAKKIETDLKRKNDTEGLGYDPLTGKLLIACKEDGDSKIDKVKGKAVYSFDPGDEKIDDKARFEISTEKIKEFLEANKDFQYDKDRIKFEPSGIAYHPIQRMYYILASNGKLLLVLDAAGEIKASYPIYPNILSQPEGITFAPDGTMYISSEGEGDRGYIIKFNMKRK